MSDFPPPTPSLPSHLWPVLTVSLPLPKGQPQILLYPGDLGLGSLLCETSCFQLTGPLGRAVTCWPWPVTSCHSIAVSPVARNNTSWEPVVMEVFGSPCVEVQAEESISLQVAFNEDSWLRCPQQAGRCSVQTPRHQLGDIRLYPELTGVQHSVAQDNGWIIFPRASPRPSISKSPSQEHSQDCCDRSQCIPTFSLGTVPSHLLSEFQSPGPSGFDPGEEQG